MIRHKAIANELFVGATPSAEALDSLHSTAIVIPESAKRFARLVRSHRDAPVATFGADKASSLT